MVVPNHSITTILNALVAMAISATKLVTLFAFSLLLLLLLATHRTHGHESSATDLVKAEKAEMRGGLREGAGRMGRHASGGKSKGGRGGSSAGSGSGSGSGRGSGAKGYRNHVPGKNSASFTSLPRLQSLLLLWGCVSLFLQL